MAESLFPGGGYTDPLIMANALRPLSEIPGQVLATRRQARALALAEQQALRAERERQFKRDLIESERRIQAAGGEPSTSGGGGRGRGGAGTTTRVAAAPVSGDIGGVPFTARSPKGVLADVLGPSAAAMQREQVGDADALMARIAAGAEEQGEFLAGRTPEEAARQRSLEMVESGLPYQFDPNDPRFRQAQELRERPVVQFDPNDPRWARAQRMEDARGGADADEFMASVAALDEKAAAEGMDATGVIRSLMEGGVIPEEVVYGGTPEEAAKQVSSLLAGLTPGELQRKKEAFPGWTDVSLSDFTRLLSEASEKGAEELTRVVDAARTEAIDNAIASMEENPTFKGITKEVLEQLARLQYGGKEAQARGEQLSKNLVGFTMKSKSDTAAMARTRAAALAANRRVTEAVNDKLSRAEAIGEAEFNDSQNLMLGDISSAVVVAKTKKSSAMATFESARDATLADGGNRLIEIADRAVNDGLSQDEIVAELLELYPEFKGDYEMAALVPLLRTGALSAEAESDELEWDQDQILNWLQYGEEPDVTHGVVIGARANHLRRVEGLETISAGRAVTPGYKYPSERTARVEAAETAAEAKESLARVKAANKVSPVPLTGEEIDEVNQIRVHLDEITSDEVDEANDKMSDWAPKTQWTERNRVLRDWKQLRMKNTGAASRDKVTAFAGKGAGAVRSWKLEARDLGFVPVDPENEDGDWEDSRGERSDTLPAAELRAKLGN